MSHAPAVHQPLPDLQNALKKMDDVAEYCRRKLEKRLKRLSDAPVVEDEGERPTLAPGLSVLADGALGSEELTPRLRRRA